MKPTRVSESRPEGAFTDTGLLGVHEAPQLSIASSECILVDMYELLAVEDSFVICGRGVVLIPDFSVPHDGWKAREEVVQVEMPDGTSHKTKAYIDWAHFSLTDPNATPDQKNRVVVRLVE